MNKEQVIDFVRKNPVGFASGVLALLLVGALYYRSEELPAAEGLLADKTAEENRLTTNLKNAVQLKEQLVTLETAEKEILTRLVRPSQLATNNQYFYKLESETGTKLIDLRQNTVGNAKASSKSGFLPVSFSLTLQGDYAQLLGTLRRLENGAHYCRVLSLSLSNAGGVRAGVQTLALTIELFGQP